MTQQPRRSQAVIGIAGWKNSGKTTLTERLIGELTARGLVVSTIKHAHHDAVIDTPGTDSDRHRRAGASEVALVTANRWALMHELRGRPEPDFAEVLAKLSPVDLVLVEGYKLAAIPKIEVRRRDGRQGSPLIDGDANVIAIAADHAVADHRVPVFELDAAAAIAEFIIQRLSLVRP